MAEAFLTIRITVQDLQEVAEKDSSVRTSCFICRAHRDAKSVSAEKGSDYIETRLIRVLTETKSCDLFYGAEV